MKSDSKISGYGDDITAVVETEVGEVNRPRSRPRIALLFALVSVLALLVVIATAFEPPSHFIVSGDCDASKEQRVTQQTLDGPYSRKIIVLEHEENYDEDEESFPEDHEENDDIDSEDFSNDWSDIQIEEMERYYERYLEVFLETHGDDYEPEAMEVVYTEYLAFKERKIRERDEKKAKEKEKMQGQMIEATPQGYRIGAKDVEDHSENDQNDRTSSFESSEFRPSRYPDNTIIKQDPYYLEMEWEDFNEVGGDHFSSSNNYTETLTTGSVQNTIAVVVDVDVDGASVKDRPAMQQSLSGRGRVYTV